MKPDVSVIVPVYKVETYLDECVESICQSSLKNIEILLIDDGSPDICGAKCDEWAQRDGRIKAFHKNNGGLSDARNYGIEKAQGEYIAFVDSDDKIHPDMLLKLYRLCQEHKLQIAMCGLYYWYPSHNDQLYEIRDNFSSYDVQQMDYKLFKGIHHNTAWRKLYHRSLFANKINRFPKGLYHEDIGFWWLMMAQINDLGIINEPLYYYRQENPNSICQTKDSVRHMSDTISSFYFAFAARNKILPEKKEKAYVSAFLECYLDYIQPGKYMPRAQKEHQTILNYIKNHSNLMIYKKKKQKYIYIPRETPLLKLKILPDQGKIKFQVSLRCLKTRILDISVGKCA